MSEGEFPLSPPQPPYTRAQDLDAYDQYTHSAASGQRPAHPSHYSRRVPSIGQSTTGGAARTREASWVSQFQHAQPNHFHPNPVHHQQYSNGHAHAPPPPPGPINIPPPAPIARGRSELGTIPHGAPATEFGADEELMEIDPLDIARGTNLYGTPLVARMSPLRPHHQSASASTPALLNNTNTNSATYPHPMEVEAPRSSKKRKGGFVGGFFMGLLKGRSKRGGKKGALGRQNTLDGESDLDGGRPVEEGGSVNGGGLSSGIPGRPPQYSSQPPTPINNHVPTHITYATTTAPTNGGGESISMPIPELHEPDSARHSQASTTPTTTPGMVRRPSLRVSVHPPSEAHSSTVSRPRTESERLSRHPSTVRRDVEVETYPTRRRTRSESEAGTIHRPPRRRDTRATATTERTESSGGRSRSDRGGPGGRHEDGEDGVYHPAIQPTHDYRKMPRAADAESNKSGANKVAHFFKDLVRLPWVRPHRITDDYQPRGRVDSRVHRGRRGHEKDDRVIVLDKSADWRKPARWYYKVSEGHHSVDLLSAGGPSASASSGGYTDSRSSRTQTHSGGRRSDASPRSTGYDRRRVERRYSDEYRRDSDRVRERDREREHDGGRDREGRSRTPLYSSPSPRSHQNNRLLSPPPQPTSPPQRRQQQERNHHDQSPPTQPHRAHRKRHHHQHPSPPPPVPPMPPMHGLSPNPQAQLYPSQPVAFSAPIYAPALVPYGPLMLSSSSIPQQLQQQLQEMQQQMQQPIIVARSHDSPGQIPVPSVVNVFGNGAGVGNDGGRGSGSGSGSQLLQQQQQGRGPGQPGQTMHGQGLMSPLLSPHFGWIQPGPAGTVAALPGSSTIPGGFVTGAQQPQQQTNGA